MTYTANTRTKKNTQGVLYNKLLIATPQVDDPLFKQSVVYIFDHTSDGSSGFIINKPTTVPVTELCAKVHHQMAKTTYISSDLVLAGGPVNTEMGFVLHSKPPAEFAQSHCIKNDLFMTVSTDVIEAIGTEKAPEKLAISLGLSFWRSGQLEEEMRRNDWLVIPADEALLFDVPCEKRWETALSHLNITPEMLSGQGGEC